MIISIKSSASGGSSRGVVHYLAHSKLDREKEGARRREFFNESENDLDVSRANRHLSLKDAKPKPEELLHIVIAPSGQEIESLGDNVKTRKDALKAIVREVVARLEKEVNARNLKWVAVAHFNTDNPHAHLALQKEFLNEMGETAHLRINRQMLHYNETSADGEKKLQKGALIQAAESKIAEMSQERRRTREKMRDSQSEKAVKKSPAQAGKSKEISTDDSTTIPNYRERRTLAEEMLVAAEIRRRERNIENLVEHGDKKRFRIKDARRGNTRHISLFDIERKIEIVSRSKARLIYPQNAEKRAELATKIAQDEHAKFEPVIRQLETIRRHVLGFENRHLSDAQAKHARLNNQKLLIEKKYERLKTAVPLPLFKTDEIQRLQTEAFREQNTEKILLLESIRQSNAAELNRPTRRERDVRELLAAKIIANLKLQAAEKRLLALSANKDFIKVKIGDSLWSHRELEQHELEAARKKGLWIQAKSKTSKILFRSVSKSSTVERLDYPALHKAVTDALSNLEKTRRDEIAKQKEFNQTLDKIFNAETNLKKIELAPAFTAFELSEAEDLAFETERENFYEKSLLLQENWLREKLAEKISQTIVAGEQSATKSDKVQKHHPLSAKNSIPFQPETDAQIAPEKIIGNFILGRAEARIILAQTKACRMQENLDRYDRDKLFIKHQIKDPKTGDERELSLREIEPRGSYYLLDRVLEKAFETKEQKKLRDAVRQAARDKEKELTQNLKNAQNFASRLEMQKTEMLEKYSGAGKVQPIFTPKEIAALEIRAVRTISAEEKLLLEKTIEQAEKNNSVIRLEDSLKKTAEDLGKQMSNFGRDPQAEIGGAALGKTEPSNERPLARTNVQETRDNSSQRAATRTDVLTDRTNTFQQEKLPNKEKGRTR